MDMDERKYKEEMDIRMEQMSQECCQQAPEATQMQQMTGLSQASPIYHMPQMYQMPQMPMMCCPYLMNVQCPMMYGQSMAGPGNMMADPYAANPYMHNPMYNPIYNPAPGINIGNMGMGNMRY